MYVQKKAVKRFFHEQGRRIKPEVINALNKKVEDVLWSALRLARGFKTITATEIEFANGSKR